jgi:hypothetical protein
MTNGIVDIEIYSDRGIMGVAAGKHGGRTFDIDVWARVLSTQASSNMAVEHQIDFFADRLEVITDLVDSEPDIETKLRDLNWVAVKDRLGIDPDARRDAPESWTR